MGDRVLDGSLWRSGFPSRRREHAHPQGNHRRMATALRRQVDSGLEGVQEAVLPGAGLEGGSRLPGSFRQGRRWGRDYRRELSGV